MKLVILIQVNKSKLYIVLDKILTTSVVALGKGDSSNKIDETSNGTCFLKIQNIIKINMNSPTSGGFRGGTMGAQTLQLYPLKLAKINPHLQALIKHDNDINYLQSKNIFATYRECFYCIL